MPAPVLMHESQDLYVEAAVLRNLEDTTLPPPANCIESGGRFLNAKSGLRDSVEAQPMACPFLHLDHQVRGLKFGDQVEDRVSHQDVVIEVQDVESDDETGATQPLDQLVHLRFAEHFVTAGGRAKGNAD